jgi:phage I-like protein
MKGNTDSTFTVVRSDNVPMGLSADGKLPERFKVLNWGENANTNKIKVVVNEALVRSMACPLYPWPVVALDFQHNTVPGHKAYLETSEPRKVAGFGAIEVVEGDGVYMRMQRWTPEGRSNALNFDDVSAAPVRDEAGNVIGIHSVALCRNGAVPGMDFVRVPLAVSESVIAALSVNTNKEKSMDFKALLITTLGLDPEIGDEELKAKVVEALRPKAAAQPDPDALSAVFTAKLAEKLGPLAQRVDALSADNAALKKSMAARDKQALIDAAGREGKVAALAADVLDGMTVDQVREHCAALSVSVPMDGRNGGANPGGGAKNISAEQREIAQRCGVDPAAVKWG